MNKTTMAIALAALLLAVSAMPGQAAPPPGVTGSCTNTTRPDGGTDVQCDLDCNYGAELQITAVSADTDWMKPSVSGGYNCGGTGAPCPPTAVACSGVSPGLTSNTGTGICKAKSEEFHASMLSVACLVVGGTNDPPPDPEDLVCEVYPDFPTCDNNKTRVPHLFTFSDVWAMCEKAAEEAGFLLPSVAAPNPGLGRGIFEMRAIVHTDHGAGTALFRDGACNAGTFN